MIVSQSGISYETKRELDTYIDSKKEFYIEMDEEFAFQKKAFNIVIDDEPLEQDRDLENSVKKKIDKKLNSKKKPALFVMDEAEEDKKRRELNKRDQDNEIEMEKIRVKDFWGVLDDNDGVEYHKNKQKVVHRAIPQNNDETDIEKLRVGIKQNLLSKIDDL